MTTEKTTPRKKKKGGICATCGASKAAYVCGQCHAVNYCSRDCQATAWKAHAKVCPKDGKKRSSSKKTGKDSKPAAPSGSTTPRSGSGKVESRESAKSGTAGKTDDKGSDSVVKKTSSSSKKGSFKCGYCKKGSALYVCTHCYTTHYCDGRCQTSHWPDHARVCDLITKKKKQEEAAAAAAAKAPSKPTDSTNGSVPAPKSSAPSESAKPEKKTQPEVSDTTAASADARPEKEVATTSGDKDQAASGQGATSADDSASKASTPVVAAVTTSETDDKPEEKTRTEGKADNDDKNAKSDIISNDEPAPKANSEPTSPTAQDTKEEERQAALIERRKRLQAEVAKTKQVLNDKERASNNSSPADEASPSPRPPRPSRQQHKSAPYPGEAEKLEEAELESPLTQSKKSKSTTLASGSTRETPHKTLDEKELVSITHPQEGQKPESSATGTGTSMTTSEEPAALPPGTTAQQEALYLNVSEKLLDPNNPNPKAGMKKKQETPENSRNSQAETPIGETESGIHNKEYKRTTQDRLLDVVSALQEEARAEGDPPPKVVSGGAQKSRKKRDPVTPTPSVTSQPTSITSADLINQDLEGLTARLKVVDTGPRRSNSYGNTRHVSQVQGTPHNSIASSDLTEARTLNSMDGPTDAISEISKEDTPSKGNESFMDKLNARAAQIEEPPASANVTSSNTDSTDSGVPARVSPIHTPESVDDNVKALSSSAPVDAANEGAGHTADADPADLDEDAVVSPPSPLLGAATNGPSAPPPTPASATSPANSQPSSPRVVSGGSAGSRHSSSRTQPRSALARSAIEQEKAKILAAQKARESENEELDKLIKTWHETDSANGRGRQSGHETRSATQGSYENVLARFERNAASRRREPDRPPPGAKSPQARNHSEEHAIQYVRDEDDYEEEDVYESRAPPTSNNPALYNSPMRRRATAQPPIKKAGVPPPPSEDKFADIVEPVHKHISLAGIATPRQHPSEARAKEQSPSPVRRAISIDDAGTINTAPPPQSNGKRTAWQSPATTPRGRSATTSSRRPRSGTAMSNDGVRKAVASPSANDPDLQSFTGTHKALSKIQAQLRGLSSSLKMETARVATTDEFDEEADIESMTWLTNMWKYLKDMEGQLQFLSSEMHHMSSETEARRSVAEAAERQAISDVAGIKRRMGVTTRGLHAEKVRAENSEMRARIQNVRSSGY